MEKIIEKLPTILNTILIIYLTIRIWIIEDRQINRNITINNMLIAQQYMNEKILKKIKYLTKFKK